jgi:predicted transcriptional regulator YdeE
MTPSLVTCEEMAVLGIEVTTSNAAESDPDKARIPALWGRFFGEDVLSKIPGKRAPVSPVGVYTDYESDHNGRYRVLVGAVVEQGTLPPEGFGRATVPAGRYLIFRGEGQMPGIVIQTWISVWQYFAEGSSHVRAYTADFELYRGQNAVDIYIAVK